MKYIAQQHPIDPETNESFGVFDSVSIKNFGMKLCDPCKCLNCYNYFRIKFRGVRKMLIKPKKKILRKPKSMGDIPDSNSDSSEENDTFKGLKPCAIYLGEGPIMYLQIMKTFLILLFLLSVLNIPIFMLYADQTNPSDITGGFQKIFEYLTIGNIGSVQEICAHSHVLE